MRYLIHFTGINEFGHKVKDSIEISAGSVQGAVQLAKSQLKEKHGIIALTLGY